MESVPPLPAANSPLSQSAVIRRITALVPNFSRVNKQVASCVLNNPHYAAKASINDLALSAGVSTASINRFSVALGYEGFPNLKRALNEDLGAHFDPVEKLRFALTNESQQSSFGSAIVALQEDVSNLKHTIQTINPAAIEAAVEAILKARTVHVLGFSISSYIAGLLGAWLSIFVDCYTVVGMAGAEDSVRRLLRIRPNDVLIAISVPRYSRDTVEFTRQARERGATVIAITDTVMSPLVEHAHTVLLTRAERSMLIHSSTAVVALCEALARAVASTSKDSLESIKALSKGVRPYVFHENRVLAPPNADHYAPPPSEPTEPQE